MAEFRGMAREFLITKPEITIRCRTDFFIFSSHTVIVYSVVEYV